MPFDKAKYPPYWAQFSRYIRFERADNKCEDCGAVNYAIGKKGIDGQWRDIDSIHGLNSDVGFALYPNFDLIGTKVILTVAHLDHEGGPCRCYAENGLKCARPDHVKALCQACHLQLDMPKHIANRRRTIAERNDAARGLLING